MKAGARILPYIGHDEPATLFYSNKPGAGNNVSYNLTLPKDPPTRPKQNGSGGTFGFQLHPTFWLGMVMCDPNGSPNVGGIPGHPAVPCKPDSDSNIFASQNPNSPKLLRARPGPGLRGDAVLPAGLGAVADGHRLHGQAVVRRAEHRHVPGQREHRRAQQHRVPQQPPAPSR